MADSYVDAKVKDALNAAHGSRSVAQTLLMNWAASDERLLRGMAQPFFKAITAAAIEGAMRRATAAAREPASGASRMSRDALEQVLAHMGEDAPPTPRAGGAGGRMRQATMALGPGMDAPDGTTHEDAMKTLAKAFAAKKLR